MRKILIPLMIIVLPLLLVLVIWRGKNVYKPLPYIGNPEGIDAHGDTIRHSIPPFSFTDQHGKTFSSEDLKGKIYVANFFFTSCPNICPVMTRNLKKVLEAYEGKDDFRIVSFSLDPERDSVAKLARYADHYGISGDQWHFLTGPRAQIYRLMNQDGFLIVKPIPGEDPDQLQHSEVMDLVDREGHIRGNYDGTKEEDIKRLIDEIKVLYLEYKRNGQAE